MKSAYKIYKPLFGLVFCAYISVDTKKMFDCILHNHEIQAVI